MKNYIYILFLFCLVLSGCGLAEPWKDWQNEGEMSDYRLRPSELKKVLCEPAGWKMIYEGVTFYFQFNEGGTLNSDTNEKMLDNGTGRRDLFFGFSRRGNLVDLNPKWWYAAVLG